jgi:hypothetical protein
MLVFLFVLDAIFAAVSFWSFDRLVLIEYQFFRECWEADGRPNGIIWRAEGRLPAWNAMGMTMTDWGLNKPPWIILSPAAMLWYRMFRLTGILSAALGVAFCIIIAVSREHVR